MMEALVILMMILGGVVSAPSSWSISNGCYEVTVSVDSTNVISMSSLVFNRNVSGSTGWSSNLLYNGDNEFKSGTGGLLSSGWVKPTVEVPPVVTDSSLHFSNISLSYADESWDLSVQDDYLVWNITRMFTADVSVLADQSPVLFFNTAVGIPGFVEPDLFWNTTSSAGFQLDTIYFEFITPNLNQQLRLAPFNVRFLSEITTSSGFFTFGKLAYDGTSPFVSLGVETVDRRKQVQEYKKGESISTTWSLRIIPDIGAPDGTIYGPEDLLLSIPGDREVEQLSKKLIPVHNTFMGTAFGNNPASVTCLHEMGLFPMMHGVFSWNLATTIAIQSHIEFLLSKGVNASGYVMPRWNSAGFYYVEWGPLHDQIPHAILAVYYHAMNTGDKVWLTQMFPTVELIASYLISLDVDGDGVPEVPNASGLSDGNRHTSNWYDIIEFGHKDAYIASYSCMALQALAEMTSWLGNATSSAYYTKLHVAWVHGFNSVFWDEALGYYRDWVDIKGGVHAYFYVDQNLLAIIFGIANKTQSKSILSNLDAQYETLSTKYNIPKRLIWSTPANMLPISVKGDMVDNGTLNNQTYYPSYENGGSFFHSAGFEIAARAVAGDPDGAYEVYRNLLVTGENVGPGFMWSALLQWDKQLMYGEPLAVTLVSTWGFIRGCFGVWPSLINGLVYSGAYSSTLEGASASFQFLGQNVNITAKNSTTHWVYV